MSFHLIERPPRILPWHGRGLCNAVSARLDSPGYGKRRSTTIRISQDLLEYLNLRAGDYVCIMIGANEDAGSFALRRGAGLRGEGYKLRRLAPRALSLHVSVPADRFLAIPEKTTVHFEPVRSGPMVVCRPQGASTALAAE